MAESGPHPGELEMPRSLETIPRPARRGAQSTAASLGDFARLVDEFKDQLVGYLFRLVGDRERAEDLAQETFLRLFQRSQQYEERGLLKAYIFRIATNLVRSEARRSFRWQGILPLLDRAPSSEPRQERDVLRKEFRRELERAIVALPLRYRAPLVLREVDGWAYRDISTSLGVSEGTIKSRIHRGRSLLRKQLAAYWEGISR